MADDINDGEKMTLAYMLTYAGCKRVWVSQSTIAIALGKSRRQIIKHFQKLEEKEYIILIRQQGKSSEIRFTGKSKGVTQSSLTGESKFTLKDKVNNNTPEELLRKSNDITEMFITYIEITPKNGQFEDWRQDFQFLLDSGVYQWQLLELFSFIENHDYWSKRILSPRDLLKEDKGGVPNYKRIIKEAGID